MSQNKEIMEVAKYIQSFEGNAREYLLELRALILEAAPKAQELINYNIPAFALIPGGKREEQIMIAGYKAHVGFYPHPDTIKLFWERLEGYRKAKGSVQFRLSKPLPKALIKDMITTRLNQVLNSKK